MRPLICHRCLPCFFVFNKKANMTGPQDGKSVAVDLSASSNDGEIVMEKKLIRQRIKSIVWDTLERKPEERRFLAKIDFFILTWASLTYFSKNLNTNNVCMYFPITQAVHDQRFH